MKTTSKRRGPSIVNLTVKRRYLTEREIERLMDCARKVSRRGHRDATMILVAYRHGLRASEVCDLQWQQIELSEGRLHVHRVKNGFPSVHPIRGDEMRALRKLRRDYPTDAHVFVSERGGPISPIGFHLRSAGQQYRKYQETYDRKAKRPSSLCCDVVWRVPWHGFRRTWHPLEQADIRYQPGRLPNGHFGKPAPRGAGILARSKLGLE